MNQIVTVMSIDACEQHCSYFNPFLFSFFFSHNNLWSFVLLNNVDQCISAHHTYSAQHTNAMATNQFGIGRDEYANRQTDVFQYWKRMAFVICMQRRNECNSSNTAFDIGGVSWTQPQKWMLFTFWDIMEYQQWNFELEFVNIPSTFCKLNERKKLLHIVWTFYNFCFISSGICYRYCKKNEMHNFFPLIAALSLFLFMCVSERKTNNQSRFDSLNAFNTKIVVKVFFEFQYCSCALW